MKAFAKVNLALVVGPLRADGKHEVVTVLQHVDLHDDVELERADRLTVDGFPEDTLVRGALEALARRRSRATLARADREADPRRGRARGRERGRRRGAVARERAPAAPARARRAAPARRGDRRRRAVLPPRRAASRHRRRLRPRRLDLPQDFAVLLALRGGDEDVDGRRLSPLRREAGSVGFDDRRDAAVRARARRTGADLAALPRNDLASSPLSHDLERLGAFRADVSGAGPVVYGLFERRRCRGAAEALRGGCAPGSSTRSAAREAGKMTGLWGVAKW